MGRFGTVWTETLLDLLEMKPSTYTTLKPINSTQQHINPKTHTSISDTRSERNETDGSVIIPYLPVIPRCRSPIETIGGGSSKGE